MEQSNKKERRSISQQFFDQVIDHMEECSVSVEELAARLEWEPEEVQTLLEESRAVGLDAVELVAEALGITVTLSIFARGPDPTHATIYSIDYSPPPVPEFENRLTIPSRRKPRGRKPGPRQDYSRHLAYMASLIFDEEMSQREAARQAKEWGDRKGLASVSAETLRGYFRRYRSRLMDQHEKRIARFLEAWRKK